MGLPALNKKRIGLKKIPPPIPTTPEIKPNKEPINKEIINVGPDEETITIKEVANLVANEIGFNGKPEFIKERPKEVKFASCSADKARKLLGYKTKTSLKDSIKKTADFIKSRGVKNFEYNLPLEIINEKTPETWKKKLI